MVMIRPPAFHIWKFLIENRILTNNGLIQCHAMGLLKGALSTATAIAT